MKTLKFKKFIRTLHLWLAMLSGIIVFIVSITGCLYAFQDEIQDITEDYRHVTPSSQPFLLPSKLEQIARNSLPDKHLHAIHYKGKTRAAEAIFYHDDPDYYHIIFLNPYSGAVTAITDEYSGFFRFVLDGHFYLWLPHEIGQTVVASATFLFLLIVITGLILWWPKNRKAARQRVWFRWKDGIKWRRKNYDLHNITGFYVSAFAVVFAVTGLVWGFPWFAYGYHALFGGETSLIYEEPRSVIAMPKAEHPIDAVYQKMVAMYPDAHAIEVHPPENEHSTVAANANPDIGTYWKIDYRYFDQYSLEEKHVSHIYGRFHKADTADQLMRMNYDLHTGALFGFAGKLFAFLISLLIASLPVTGMLLWIGRTNKRREKQ